MDRLYIISPTNLAGKAVNITGVEPQDLMVDGVILFDQWSADEVTICEWWQHFCNQLNHCEQRWLSIKGRKHCIDFRYI